MNKWIAILSFTLLNINLSDAAECKFTKENSCVPVGGHSENFRSVKGGFCAKKAHNYFGKQEIKFYKLLGKMKIKFKNNFKYFFPEYYGTCTDSETSERYMILENLLWKPHTKLRVMPLVLDVKLGTSTTSLQDLKNSAKSDPNNSVWIKSFKMFWADTISFAKFKGYRVAGIHLGDWRSEEETKLFEYPTKKKFLLTRNRAKFIFQGKKGQPTVLGMCVKNRLNRLVKELVKNAKFFYKIDSRAASILIIGRGYDDANCDVKIIDFAHTRKVDLTKESGNWPSVIKNVRSLRDLILSI